MNNLCKSIEEALVLAEGVVCAPRDSFVFLDESLNIMLRKP